MLSWENLPALENSAVERMSKTDNGPTRIATVLTSTELPARLPTIFEWRPRLANRIQFDLTVDGSEYMPDDPFALV